MYSFITPYLLITIPIGLLGFYVWYSKNNRAKEVWIFSDIEQIYHRSSIYLSLLLVWWVMSIVSLGIALAHPVSYNTSGSDNSYFLDVWVVLDSSYSMLAQDVYPNRFEASLDMIQTFVTDARWIRTGLYVYAGAPFELSPYSFDTDALIYDIKNVQIDTIDQTKTWLQWTASADALLMASLQTNDAIPSALVLISDGEINRGQTPLAVVQYLKGKNIPVYTIWIGWWEKVDVPIYDTLGWKQVVSVEALQSDTLEAIAYHTWGKYFSFGVNTVDNILLEIYEIEKQKIYTQWFRSYRIYVLCFFLFVSISTTILWYRKFYPNI